MKLLITWIRKNGNCRCWTNADRAEHLAMGMVAFRDSIERKAREEQMSFDEAWEKVFNKQNLNLKEE